MGSTASEAFRVACEPGSTMTSQNLIDGRLIVQITLQVTRPAEFIELTVGQVMEEQSSA